MTTTENVEAIATGTASNGVAHRLRRLDKRSAPPPAIAAGEDHIAIRRRATEALRAEHDAILARAAEIAKELGIFVPQGQTYGPLVSKTSVRPTLPAGPTSPAGKRAGRRSVADIDRLLTDVVAIVSVAPSGRQAAGLRAEQIRKQLGLSPNICAAVLRHGLKTNQLRATGQKRATTYFAKP